MTITQNFTPLMFASQAGDIVTMRQELARGAEINEQDAEGWTALHWAASTGEVEPVRVLLEAGAYVDAQDCDDWTPVMWAAWQGDLDVLRLFAEYKDLREVLERGRNETGDAWVAIRHSIHRVLDHLWD